MRTYAERFINNLKREGIEATFHYVPYIILLTDLRSKQNYILPITEKISSSIVRFPCGMV